MEPNSIGLVVVLLLAAAALQWVLVRFSRLLVRVLAGVLALTFAGLAGIAVVNDYYGYYTTWGQVSADLSGNYAAFATAQAHGGIDHFGTGKLVRLRLAGPRSGINRSALVYLPPQYSEKRFAHTRFPVVELMHGTPGGPATWVVHVEIVALMDKLIRERQIGPMVIVMPRTYTGHNYEECVNAPGALDDTYLTQDVRTAIEDRFRVTKSPAEWGIAGFSSGGFCAADLALRHPAMFGASAVMDGYFRPQDGEAAGALHHDPAAEAANDPLRLAAALPPSAGPLPAFWVSAGTQQAADLRGAIAFVHALDGVEQVPFYRDTSAGHSFYEWDASMPHVLAWMWAQLAPPDIRVLFPLAGPVQNEALVPRVVFVGPTERVTRPPTRPTAGSH